MYLNKFSVRIPGAVENNQYVSLKHNQQYSINLKNDHEEDAKACVSIDGKIAGLYVVKGKSMLNIDSPQNINQKFTFYKADSKEAGEIDLQKNENLGLISVEFIPLKKTVSVNTQTKWIFNYINTIYVPQRNYYPIWIYEPSPFLTPTYTCSTSNVSTSTGTYNSTQCSATLTSGGTGLSGVSDTEYERPEELAENYDVSNRTIIYLRLVCDDKIDLNKPRKFEDCYHTNIPPSI